MLRWPSRAVASPLPHVSRRGVHTSTTSLQQPEKAWGKVFQGNHQATGPQTYSHRVARRERGAESRLSTLPHARLAARPATTYEQRVCVCRGKCSSLQLKLATFSPYISPYSQRPTRIQTIGHICTLYTTRYTDTVHTTLSNTLGPASRTSPQPLLFVVRSATPVPCLQGTSATGRDQRRLRPGGTHGPTLAAHTARPLGPE